jgi:hypothetical protein
MAAPTAAELAAKLKGDNRTVVGSKSPTNAANDFVATDVGPDGAAYGLANAKVEGTSAAYEDGVTRGTGSITVEEGNGGLTKNDLRTQYFHVGSVAGNGTYDATQAGFGAKRCFVNSKGQPLDANGAPTDVASAVDAETTDLSALGEAVTNWAQVSKYTDRTPPPGTYDANERQTSLYAPYAGWTAQDALT